MKGFDVLHVKSAVKARNRIPLSASHLTTLDIGQIIPLKFYETIPGGEYPVQYNLFSRTAPLVKPTYGKVGLKTVNAFVPYHQVAYDAPAFIDGKNVFEGSVPIQRALTVSDLHNFIDRYCVTYVGASSANTQYTYTNSNGNKVYCLFTDLGRYFVKVLNCLGYALPEGVDLQSGSQWLTKVAPYRFSAYPLLAFFKLYNDYMSQSQRYNTSALSAALQAIKYNKTYTGYNTTTGVISDSLLKSLFDQVLLNYENDYFTSAWQNPNCPLGSVESYSTESVPSDVSTITVDTYNTQVVHPQQVETSPAVTPFQISQRALDLLRSFDDFVRRNNFSGSREVQQLYSRFGVKSDDYRSHYAQVFSVEDFPIQVGDVTATADSSSVPLGDYAGKAIVNGQKGFTCKVSDFGIILVLGFITVTPMNAYGFDRMVLRNQPYDYYKPEFDGIGADPISVGEFYCNPIGTGTTLDTDVYGFTERFNAYRFDRDQITGDFRDFRSNGDMNCWHTGRNLEAVRSAGNLVAQSTTVNTMPQTGSEYNRIFSVTSGTVDHFYLTCQFKCDAVLPVLSLNQTARLGEGDTTVPRNGNTIA